MSTFKDIKIDAINKAAITAALQKVNGAANAHTLRTYAAVEQLAADAEARLIDLIGPRARGAGAQLTYTSGQDVAMSYRYSFRATKVVLERRGCNWYLVSIKCADVYPSAGSGPKLFLTPAQNLAAIAYTQKKYGVLKPKSEESPKAAAGVDETASAKTAEPREVSHEVAAPASPSETDAHSAGAPEISETVVAGATEARCDAEAMSSRPRVNEDTAVADA